MGIVANNIVVAILLAMLQYYVAGNNIIAHIFSSKQFCSTQFCSAQYFSEQYRSKQFCSEEYCLLQYCRNSIVENNIEGGHCSEQY